MIRPIKTKRGNPNSDKNSEKLKYAYEIRRIKDGKIISKHSGTFPKGTKLRL